jgi:hypothetical protein
LNIAKSSISNKSKVWISFLAIRINLIISHWSLKDFRIIIMKQIVIICILMSKSTWITFQLSWQSIVMKPAPKSDSTSRYTWYDSIFHPSITESCYLFSHCFNNQGSHDNTFGDL